MPQAQQDASDYKYLSAEGIAVASNEDVPLVVTKKEDAGLWTKMKDCGGLRL